MQPFTSLYTHNDERSKLFATVNNEESMTQQDDAQDCDINVIMKRYGGTGQLPVQVREPLYGDFTTASDYRTMLDTIRATEEAWGEIPAEVRDRFNNDPEKFMDFINDEKNLDEARKLGLALPEPPPPTPPEPMLVRVVEDRMSENPPGGPKP